MNSEMSKKERGAIEKLNLSLAGIESTATVIETLLGDQFPPILGVLKAMREHTDAARDHMIDIQFHLSKL